MSQRLQHIQLISTLFTLILEWLGSEPADAGKVNSLLINSVLEIMYSLWQYFFRLSRKLFLFLPGTTLVPKVYHGTEKDLQSNSQHAHDNYYEVKIKMRS